MTGLIVGYSHAFCSTLLSWLLSLTMAMVNVRPSVSRMTCPIPMKRSPFRTCSVTYFDPMSNNPQIQPTARFAINQILIKTKNENVLRLTRQAFFVGLIRCGCCNGLAVLYKACLQLTCQLTASMSPQFPVFQALIRWLYVLLFKFLCDCKLL